MDEFSELRDADAPCDSDTPGVLSLGIPQPYPLGVDHDPGDTQIGPCRAKRPPKPRRQRETPAKSKGEARGDSGSQNLDGCAHSSNALRKRHSPAVEAPFDADGAHLERATRNTPSPTGLNPILGDDGAQLRSETHCSRSPVIAEIQSLWRQRQRWVRAEGALVNQAKAICRAFCDGDKTAGTALFNAMAKGKSDNPFAMAALSPFLPAIKRFHDERKPIDRRLEKLAKGLPIYPWVKEVSGFGAGNLARLVGDAGEIGTYRNPSCLWKRMGLAVIDGERQRKCTDKKQALIHGYAPYRRASAYIMSDCILKKESRYRPVYDERKARKMSEGWTKKHAHKEAMRFMIKRILLDLWVEWKAYNACTA